MRVAVTGTMGSGKSACMAYLQEWGYPTVSADAINASLLENPLHQKAIIAKLHLPFFDKRLLADAIFADPASKAWVEGYLHPLILQTILDQTAGYPLSFAEVPLLFECGWQRYFDATIVVTCRREIAIKRLCEQRGIARDEAMRRAAFQIADDEKERLADFVVRNEADRTALQNQIKEIVKILEER